MGKHEVTIVTDWTLPMLTVHSAVWVPPVPPPAPIYPHLDMMAMIGHFGGMGTVHALTSTVFHQNVPIAQDGHDCGFLIGHVTTPMHNVMLIIHMLCSSQKTTFGASTVKMNGTATGVIDLTGGCPMIVCADPVGLPILWAPTNMTNTVYVGTTAGDIAMGWLAAAFSMALDFVVGKIPFGKQLAKKLSKPVADSLAKALETLIKFVIGKGITAVSAPSSPSAAAPATAASADAAAATASATPSTTTTSSPFGDSSITTTQSPDGSFNAVTRSPTSGGGQREQRNEGLGVLGPADEEPEPQSDELADAFRAAPSL